MTKSLIIDIGQELGSPARTCSLAAQGLWWRLRLLMHEGTPYGHLAITASPMSDPMASARCGVAVDQYRECLDELELAGAFERNDDGVIFCRTMARSERHRRMARGRMRTLRKRDGKRDANVTRNVTGTSRATLRERDDENAQTAVAAEDISGYV